MADTPAPLPAEAFPERLGPCRLRSKLGSGGMGTVYLAEMAEERPYAGPGVTVAVKVLHPALVDSPDSFARFAREAQIGKSLDSPFVVKTLAAESAPVGGLTHHFLILEYVAGKTLREVLADLGTVPEPLLRDLAAKVARALAVVHAAGAVHRDLKPSNVLVTPAHQVKLLDLGTARLLDDASRVTRSGFFVGTLRYAAPEQFDDTPAGPAADLYALGVVIYEAATGVNPFEDSDVLAVLRRHAANLPPPRATQREPSLSPLLDELIAALLAKAPAERLGPADAVAEVLEQGEASAWWRGRDAARFAAKDTVRPHLRVSRETALVGRAGELQQLVAAFDRARAGQGGLVLLEGEAGVGKTRLVDTFLAELASRGDPVELLYGSSPPGEASGGRGALADAVLNRFGAGALLPALEAALARVPLLVSGFAAYLGAPRASAQPLSRDGLHVAFAELARSLASRHPLVWIVDDLHFSSPEGRALAASLARSSPGQRMLVIATLRPGPLAHEFAALFNPEHVRRVPLGRLSAAEVIELLAAATRSETLADRLGGKVARKSDGNPYFILEILRELRERGTVRPDAAGALTPAGDLIAIEVPSNVRDMLNQRLREIGEEDRALLEVGAVQGFAFDPDLIARVLERRRLEVLQALAALERRLGIVRAAGAAFQFDHHQLQEVIYGGLAPALKREYHALIADAFAAREGSDRGTAPASPERALFLAEHYLRGGRGREGAGNAVPALDLLAERYEHDRLLDLSALAIDAVRGVDPALECDLIVRRLLCLAHVGRGDEACELIDPARAAAEASGDESRICSVLALAGGQLASRCAYREAAPVLERAVALAGRLGDRAAEARIHGHLADLAFHTGEEDQALAAAERMLAAATAAGQVRLLATAHFYFSTIHVRRCEFEPAAAHAERMRDLGREAGQAATEVLALSRLAIIDLQREHFAAAARHLDAMQDLSRRMAYHHGEVDSERLLGHLALRRGDLGAARAHAVRAVAISGSGNQQLALAAHLLELEVLLAAGDVETASSLLPGVLAEARASGMMHAIGICLQFQGDLASSLDRPDEALAAWGEALGAGHEEADAVSNASLALGRHALAGRRAGAAVAHFRTAAERAATPSIRRLAGAYLVLAGEREASGAAPAPPADEPGSVLVEAETRLVLAAAGAGDSHRDLAQAILTRIEDPLAPAERERFRRYNPVARMLARPAP